MALNPRDLGWFRFKLGEFECTAVWDGTLYQPYEGIYPNADPGEIRNLMKKYDLPQDNIPMDLNVLIVNTGQDLIMVDPGMGTGDIFGDGMGHMPANLEAAGIDPDDISLVLISHLHPDHAWGLVDGKGAPIFDKARLGVTKLDWDYWTDEAKLECDDHRAAWVKGTLDSVAPYRDRMVWVEDDAEIVPGASAKLTPGHSPGHSAFLFQSSGENLMSLGDCTHHAVYEVQHPEWYYSLDYDTIPDLAVKSRRMIYNLVVSGKHQVMGYHFPWPGLGHIEKNDGVFEFFAIDA
jgi:glyoxylase-like metal-dependent hydrolase (beta-lactamase superfamily II)